MTDHIFGYCCGCNNFYVDSRIFLKVYDIIEFALCESCANKLIDEIEDWKILRRKLGENNETN